MKRASVQLTYPSLLAAAAAALFLSLPARAAVVLDTFGPGNSANGTNYSLFNNMPDSSDGQFLAVSFTLTQASEITDILTSIDGSGSFNLGVVAGAGLPAGAFVHSTVLTDPTANSAVSGLSWTLGAGSYWLVSRPEAGASASWAGGQQSGTTYAFTFSASDAEWSSAGVIDSPAARITVTVIPEPATWALMLGGLALCGAAVRLRRG